MDDVVEFDGFDRPRKLRLNVNAISEFERAMEMSIGQAVLQADRLNIYTIRMLLWAAMKGDDRRLTPEQAGDLMDGFFANGGELQALADVLVETVQKSRVMTVKGPKANGEAKDMTTTSPQSESGSGNT